MNSGKTENLFLFQRTFRTPLLVSFFIFLFSFHCGREESVSTPPSTQNPSPEYTFLGEIFVDPDQGWVPTGISLKPQWRYKIVGETIRGLPAYGNPVANLSAPIPTYGVDGLIGRVGEKGFPFPIPGIYELATSSLNRGMLLYVGRNLPPPSGITVPNLDPVTTGSARKWIPPYTPERYRVRIFGRETNAPALLTPIDNFYTNQANPIFGWDQLNNASQYLLEISDFSDFRRIIFTVNVNTTSVNTSLLGVSFPFPTTGSTPSGPSLTEGLYYWRVMAQINVGRLLSPELIWTEHSVPFRIGVETGQTLPSPIPLNVTTEVSVKEDQVIAIEFLQKPDASGLFWRYLTYHGSCGEAITSTNPSLLVEYSPWMVFQQEFQRNRIVEPPLSYGYLATPILSRGEWLVRIETRDGEDITLSRMGVLEIRIHAGCGS